MDRRKFISALGKGVGGTLALAGILASKPARAQKKWVVDGRPLKISHAKDTTSICPFCGVGCGLLVTSRDGKIINIEGDPDHPINEGALCSKGSSVFQIAQNERRLSKVLYRAPGSTDWKEISWNEAIDKIARNVIKSRNETFVKTQDGITVNRTEGICNFGGAALDTEECYLVTKLARALGLVKIEHQARI